MPDLFQGLGEGAPGRGATCLSVKQAGLDLPESMLTSPENWAVSCFITGQLVAALRGQVEFRTADHSACLQEGRTSVWKRSSQREEETLEATIVEYPVQGAR